LVSSMGFEGHVAPLLGLVRELSDRQHRVRVYTGSAFSGRVSAAGGLPLPWAVAPDFDERNLPATFPQLRGGSGLRQTLQNLELIFIGTAPSQLADLRAAWSDEPWDVAVVESSCIGAAFAGEALPAPYATVSVLPFGMPSRQRPPIGFGLTPGRGLIGHVRDAALRGAGTVLSARLDRALARARIQAGLPPTDQHWFGYGFSPSMVLATGSPSLDFGGADRPAEVHYVGRVAPPGRVHPLPEWWPELEADGDGRPIVLVTQGTFNTDEGELIGPTVDALGDTELAVVVATGRRGVTSLTRPVARNVYVHDWVPFDQVLPTARCLVTNGGWGGTLAALSHGVPLVVAGSDLDKPEVAARVAWTGAGINLRTGRPATADVGSAVERVLTEPGYLAAASRMAEELSALGGASRAADLIERLVGADRA
jgi:UDP:flavonoid glycosyltransferase YjiC (YdhE family)